MSCQGLLNGTCMRAAALAPPVFDVQFGRQELERSKAVDAFHLLDLFAFDTQRTVVSAV